MKNASEINEEEKGTFETLLLGNTNKNKPTRPMVNECSWNVRWYDAKTNPPGKMNESVLKVAAPSVFYHYNGN